MQVSGGPRVAPGRGGDCIGLLRAGRRGIMPVMASPRRFTLPRSLRLRSKADFDHLFRTGLRASDRYLTMVGDVNACGSVRLGISASRRLGGAVQRNRVKRLVREAFRRIRDQLPAGTDLVVIPRSGCSATVQQFELSILGLAGKIGERLVRQSRQQVDENHHSGG